MPGTPRKTRWSEPRELNPPPRLCENRITTRWPGSETISAQSSARGRIRTCTRRLRSPLLLSVELRERVLSAGVEPASHASETWALSVAPRELGTLDRIRTCNAGSVDQCDDPFHHEGVAFSAGIEPAILASLTRVISVSLREQWRRRESNPCYRI